MSEKPVPAIKPLSALSQNEVAEIREKLLNFHDRLLRLCDRLESIADSLPDKVDTQECLRISRSIFATVKETHRFEESHVFPLLQEKEDLSAGLDENLRRLKFEHWEDESYAQEICDSLISFVTFPVKTSPDTLSYMMRGFFEGKRRHIAFEIEYVLPLLQASKVSEA